MADGSVTLRSPLDRGAIDGVRLRVLSLGAGVQSSTLALLAARGEIGPMPDCAVFADTGAEPRRVYEWLDWLETQLPFPVYRVSRGNLTEDLIRAGDNNTRPGISLLTRVAAPPLYTKGPDGKMGMIPRQCTRDYKIEPIRQKVRELLGIRKRQRGGKVVLAEQWIGISLDELTRVKESREAYIAHRWPLVERRWSRQHCIAWMQKNFGRVAPRSACVFCPFHDDEEYRYVREDQDDWDTAIRGGLRKMDHELYVHRSCVPLAEADLSGGVDPNQLSMLDECDGMCGV